MRKLLPILVLGHLGVAACGSVRPTQGSGAGPEEPGRDLTVWLEELEARAGHVIRARNDSDRVYRVTGVTLRDCANIREACEGHRVDVVLCPGESARIFGVHPATPQGRTSFRWDYRARSYEPGEPVVGADCGAGGGASGPH